MKTMRTAKEWSEQFGVPIGIVELIQSDAIEAAAVMVDYAYGGPTSFGAPPDDIDELFERRTIQNYGNEIRRKLKPVQP